MANKKGAINKGPRPKHIPARTCVACRETQAKRELIRIVRTPSGQVEVDLTGKRTGRGAYLCRAKPCWDMAFRKKALEHALKTQMSPDNRLELDKFIETLPES